MRHQSILFAGSVIVAAALLVSCMTPGPQPGKSIKGKPGITRSGFLGDYSDLAISDENKGVLVYLKSPGILESYDKFIVDPIEVFLHARSEADSSGSAEVQELANFFRNELIEEIEKGGYQVVQQPGAGVARFRGAITDVRPGAGLDVGVASVEVELLDSQTRERVAAAMDSKRGRRFFNPKGQTKWGDAKKSFREWAEGFRRALDKAHAKK